jgi:malate/lactate dehydrogenase
VGIKPSGVEKILPLGELSDYESVLVKAAVPELKDNIAKVGRISLWVLTC